MGLFDDLHPPIATRNALVDGTPGVDIYPELAPAVGEHVIKKHRYSGFLARTGHHPARVGSRYCHRLGDDHRELLPRHGAGCDVSQLRVVFLSDATATYDYPDEDLARCQPPTSTTPRW